MSSSDRPLSTPTDLDPAATEDISAALNPMLADVFALYLKTKNFNIYEGEPCLLNKKISMLDYMLMTS